MAVRGWWQDQQIVEPTWVGHLGLAHLPTPELMLTCRSPLPPRPPCTWGHGRCVALAGETSRRDLGGLFPKASIRFGEDSFLLLPYSAVKSFPTPSSERMEPGNRQRMGLPIFLLHGPIPHPPWVHGSLPTHHFPRHMSSDSP